MAYTERGLVKRSKVYQAKKHVSQLNNKELYYLAVFGRGVKRITRNNHFKRRLIENKIEIELKDIVDTLNNLKGGNIIEYNETYDRKRNVISQRILLRLNKIYHIDLDNLGKIVPCYGFVVLNLSTSEVITGYHNYIGDNHENIFMGRYNSDLRVRKIRSGGYPLSQIQPIDSNEMKYAR